MRSIWKITGMRNIAKWFVIINNKSGKETSRLFFYWKIFFTFLKTEFFILLEENFMPASIK